MKSASENPANSADITAGERRKCDACGGDGFRRINDGLLSGPCEKCNGSGEIVIWGARIVSWPCPHCNGTGRSPAAPSPSTDPVSNADETHKT